MKITDVINTYLAEKEVAYRIEFISADQINNLAKPMRKNDSVPPCIRRKESIAVARNSSRCCLRNEHQHHGK